MHYSQKTISSYFHWTSVSSKRASVTIPEYLDFSMKTITLYIRRYYTDPSWHILWNSHLISTQGYTNSPVQFSAESQLVIVVKCSPKFQPHRIFHYTTQWACLFLISLPQPISEKSRFKLRWRSPRSFPNNCLLALYRRMSFSWGKMSCNECYSMKERIALLCDKLIVMYILPYKNK